MNDIDFIIAYESGELSREEIVAGFQSLIDSGTINHLQGSYQRQALELIKSGACTTRQQRLTAKILAVEGPKAPYSREQMENTPYTGPQRVPAKPVPCDAADIPYDGPRAAI